MKKIKFLAVLAISLLAISGMVMAQGPKGNDNIRVIAPTTSFMDKLVFRMKGCSIMHELNDATALKCPAGIAKNLNVREDRIFQIVDLEADQQIHADDVWAQGIDGTGINVAVLDTGIDMDHPELDDCYIGGYDYVDDDNLPEDWHGHGTHVSGIITADGVDANAKGVAPGAGIYMYKVCGTYGCYETDMMAAMEAAVLTDAKVMSISIGGGNFAGENCDSDPLAAKVNWVVNNGITVVVASGNDRYYVSSPACASGAIAVGATDTNGLMASFSNFGPALDIVAPGVAIYSSLIGGYGYMGGTSMSTPHVSGTVALMLEANPGLTVGEIKTALDETADPINLDSVCYGVVRIRGRTVEIGVVECTSDNYGAGIVDAYGAVNYYAPTVVCSSDTECDDTNECTTDTCVEPGTTSSYCENTAVVDDTTCTDGICCGGTCSAATCSVDADCDDAETCTTDTCYSRGTCSAFCSNEWSPCNLLESDGCCGPECTSETDVDCVVLVVCGDDICAGNFEGQLNGEDCNTCPADCLSRTTGKPSGRYCCGNGICESAEEILGNCLVDCS